MPDYRKMYAIAFNAISDALEELDKLNIGVAKECLREAQYHTEEIYISQSEDTSDASDDFEDSEESAGSEDSAE